MRGRVLREKTAVAFFHEQLLAAMKHQKVSASAFTEFYLVNLLAAFVGARRLPGREAGFDETPLALLYARALEVSGWERAARLRATADTALFISGFFPDSLPRGDRDLGYYASLGEQAYARLGRDHERQASAATGVFTELAVAVPRLRGSPHRDRGEDAGSPPRAHSCGSTSAGVAPGAGARRSCSSSRGSPRPSPTPLSGTEPLQSS